MRIFLKVVSFRYKEKISELKKIVYDTPMPPVETAVWWIEYAIRHKGAPHYKYRGVEVPFWEYYFLDIFLLFLIILAVLVILVRNFFCKILKMKNMKEKKN